MFVKTNNKIKYLYIKLKRIKCKKKSFFFFFYSLGAFHDVDYGVKRCYDGFIMGPPGSTGNRVKFSPCSRNSISKYLQ